MSEKRTILVVDDEEAPREHVAKICKSLGFEVVEASNIQEVIRLLNSQIAYVLCDSLGENSLTNYRSVVTLAKRLGVLSAVVSGNLEYSFVQNVEELGVSLIFKDPNGERLTASITEELQVHGILT